MNGRLLSSVPVGKELLQREQAVDRFDDEDVVI